MTATQQPKPLTDHLEALSELVDAALVPPDFDDLWIDPDAQLLDEQTERREAWRIDGERTATWAARRYAHFTRDQAAAKTAADELRAVADEYEAAVARRCDPAIRFFTGKLREYRAEVIAERGKRESKTVELAGAKLEGRIGSVSVVLSEEESEVLALVDWLEEHELSEAVDYGKPRPKKDEIKSRFGDKVDAEEPGEYPALDAETGEVLPGVKLVRGEPTFKVTLIDAAPEEGL